MTTHTATNIRRKGPIKGRSQFWNSRIGRFLKRDTVTGKIIDVKADDRPFKRVRKEK